MLAANTLRIDDKGTPFDLFFPLYQIIHHFICDEPSLVKLLLFFISGPKVQPYNLAQIYDGTAAVSGKSADEVLDAAVILKDVMEDALSREAILVQFYLRIPNFIVGLVTGISINREFSKLKLISTAFTH
jgi:hypothetical protein